MVYVEYAGFHNHSLMSLILFPFRLLFFSSDRCSREKIVAVLTHARVSPHKVRWTWITSKGRCWIIYSRRISLLFSHPPLDERKIYRPHWTNGLTSGTLMATEDVPIARRPRREYG